MVKLLFSGQTISLVFNTSRITEVQNFPIQYQVFDCLKYKGKDLTALPLIERKNILRKALPESDIIKFCDHVETEGKLLFDQITKMDLEGMIAKLAGSKYLVNVRSKSWLKIKNHNFGDYLIIGFLHSGTYIKR
jgi:bifunctional non-homologous end joining protein LigD